MAGRIILLWGWRRAFAAFAGGAIAVLAEPPFDFFAAAVVAFPLLVLLLDGAAAAPGVGAIRRMAPAFATGWWFGFGFFVAGLWWVGNALMVEADRFAWALPLALLALPALLAVFFGVATALAGRCWSEGLGRVAALAAAFGLTEWLRSFVLTGFPWNPLGQMAMPTPMLMQSASVVGPFAMNALAVFLFALPALAFGRVHRRTGLALAIVLAAVHAGYGFARLAAPSGEGEMAVRIVQPSTPLEAEWTQADREAAFARLVDLTGQKAQGDFNPELVVWSETAVPFLFSERPETLSAIGETLSDNQILMTGAVREEGEGPDARYYNSLVVIDESGAILDASDKVHLVPFGEYVPFPDVLRRLGLEQLVQTVGGYSSASVRRHVRGPGGRTFVPLICYETIFPGEVAAAAAGADILINLTVDTWFGATPGPWQHLRQAQLRAVETGLPMIRAANSGISAIVDSRGRIVDALSLDSVGVLDAKLPIAKSPSFTRSSQSLIFVAIIIVLIMFACAMNRKPAT